MLELCPTCGTPSSATRTGEPCAACLLRIGLEPDPNNDQTADDADTVINPQPNPAQYPQTSTAPAHLKLRPIEAGRLQLHEEVARGGVGAVLRAYDAALGREIAVKVLQDRHRNRPDLISRFIQEARIAGQLQHPGIVPVYELNALADQRPYFAMKLVKGQTLADLLATREQRLDRSSLLRILLKLAEALAYAHERDVVHLDVKPGNVMVGKHGEVQLMDWGLARITSTPTNATTPTHPTNPANAPSQNASSGGHNAGTPAFMAPERFQNCDAAINPRSDVFALGAILFDVLADRPLYDTRDPAKLRAAAEQADTTAALSLLERANVPPDLADLVRRCLAHDPADRPRHAGEVAARLAQHFETVEARARQAELARVRAEAGAAGERKRRRLIAGLATTALALIVAVGAWLFASQSEQNAHAASRALALQELRTAADLARNDPAGKPQPWRAARDVAARIAPVFATAPHDAADTYTLLASEVATGYARALSDQHLLAALERARAAADDSHYASAAEQIEQAFSQAGINVLANPQAAGAALAARPPRVRAELVAALDIWAAILASPRMLPEPLRGRAADVDRTTADWNTVHAAVSAADPDPWRNRLRDAYHAADTAALTPLADDPALHEQPAAGLWLAAKLFAWQRETPRALQILETARTRFPADFWINHELAVLLHRSANRPADALNYATAAVSLRPTARIAHVRRAMILAELGRIPEAENVLRRLIAAAPQYGPAYYRLANLLNFNTTRYEEAIKLYRAAEQHEPVRAQPARIALGDALLRLGRGAEAIPVYERAVEWAPDDLVSVCMLARAYSTQARLADARELINRAAHLNPENELQANLRNDVTREVTRLARLLETPWNESLEPLMQDERLALAELAARLDMPARAANLYARALDEDPVLAADQERYVRWTAATQAVAAAAGHGQDAPPPTPAERAAFFQQALNWLNADLDIQRERLASEDPALRTAAAEWLRYAWHDPCFAPARAGDPPGAALSPGWQKFWTDIQTLME